MKFLVKLRDDRRQTQNSEVVGAGTHQGIEDDYYRYFEEVIELLYIKDYRVILFKRKWFNTDRRRKHIIYEPHCISIDTSREAYKEDPFVFATQVHQVFLLTIQASQTQTEKLYKDLIVDTCGIYLTMRKMLIISWMNLVHLQIRSLCRLK